MKRVFIILMLLFIIGCNQIPKTPVVCVHHDCFSVEIADDYQERKDGLMFRESLGKNEGMLFIYPDKNERFFWMKNTLIPLDILWITNNTVVYVSDNTPPCPESDSCPVYGTDIPVEYILEVSSDHNFTENMKVTFNGIE